MASHQKPPTKKQKAIKYLICIILAVAAAVGGTAIVISIINNASQEETYTYYSSIIIYETEIVDEYVAESSSIQQTKENTVVVDCDPVDTSGLSVRQTRIPLKYIPQNPELPTGCEITSLTAVLRYYGYNVSKTDMADKYLDKTMDKIGDFSEIFVGNPRSNGFGCYAKPIVNAANKYFKSHGNRHIAVNYSGTDFEDLLKLVEQGKPVVIWSTMYGKAEKTLREPFKTVKWLIDGKEVEWIAPEHCMVLVGFDLDRNVAIMADPQRGIAEYDLFTVKSRYIAMHSQCVVLEDNFTLSGIKDGEIYYTTQFATFSEKTDFVTVNGERRFESFLIEGNADKTYEIVITDIDGKTSKMTVYTKPISEILDSIKNLSEGTVTSENESIITDIKNAVLELDTSYSSPDESRAVDDATAFCDKLLNKIEFVKSELDRINKSLNKISADGLSLEDSDALLKLSDDINALIISQNLTAEQQTIANDLNTKCQNLINSIRYDE